MRKIILLFIGCMLIVPVHADAKRKFISKKTDKPLDNTISKKELQNKYDFNDIVDQFLIGDIDNDNKDELITFSHTKGDENTTAGDPIWYTYYLNIYDVSSAGLEPIWTDNKSLKHSYSSEVPGDRLAKIKELKLYSSTVNILVIQEGQSDVRPSTTYNYMWDKNKLMEFSTVKTAAFVRDSKPDIIFYYLKDYCLKYYRKNKKWPSNKDELYAFYKATYNVNYHISWNFLKDLKFDIIDNKLNFECEIRQVYIYSIANEGIPVYSLFRAQLSD